MSNESIIIEKRLQNLNLDRFEFAAQSVRQLKRALPSRMICDVGAGDERLRFPIEAEGMEWRGFDLAPMNARIVRWDLDEESPVAAKGAGMVLLLEVIEHLRNPGVALRHLAEILPVGGRLLITTPNPRWSRSRLHALRTGFLACFTQRDLDLNAHVFPVWPHVLVQLLRESGFTVDSYVTLDGATVWPGRPLTLRYPLRFIHAVLNKWIERRDLSACGMSYGMIARRNSGSSARC
jgi:SAM-dependent methyltransferase